MMYKSSFWFGGALLLAAYFVQNPAPFWIAPNVASADEGPATFESARSIVGEHRRGHILIEGLEPQDRTGRPSRFPARVGLRLTRGLLFEPTVVGRLIGRGGTGVPCEARVIESWEDGSVRALVLAFVADLGESYLFDPTGVPESLPGPMAVDTATGVTVSTGALEVEFVDGVNRVFESARVAGVETLASSTGTGFVMLDEAGVEMTLTELDFEVERDDGLEAVVRADGTFVDAAGTPQAMLSVRYTFYRDEAVVRIMHTATWMPYDIAEGSAEWSMRLYPVAGEPHVGVDGQDLTPGPTFAAFQESADEMVVAEQRHGRLDGWIEAESTVGLALAHPWQTYPTTLAADADGALRVAFWPRESEAIMEFSPEAVMTPVIFYHDEFAGVPGHFESQWEDNPNYQHTGQGASRTHEVYVSFHPGAEGRPTTEMSAMAQHPVVLRQDPVSALTVPIRGVFDVAPTGRLPPDIERALEALGAMTVARWASAEDYGFWRFGMARHGGPLWTLYRWNDASQYDQQLIPWVLFMRGGDRRFFEEAMIMTRHFADAAINHYNDRYDDAGYKLPPGAMDLASGLPFLEHLAFAGMSSAAHSLRFATQLTGDERLLDVRDEAFEGAVQYLSGPQRGGFLFDPSSASYRGNGRALYKGTAFFAEAYSVRGDTTSRDLFQEYLMLFLGREYDPALRVYRHPEIYIGESLLIADSVWAANPSWGSLTWTSGGVSPLPPGMSLDRDALRDQLEEHLQELGYDDPERGVADVQLSVTLPWMEAKTGNPVYGDIGWDLARTLADMVPDFDYDPEEYPAYPFKQSRFVRNFFMPILVNASAAVRRGAAVDDGFVRQDLFVSLLGNGSRTQRNTYVRARHDGDLHIEVTLVQPECPAPDVDIEIFDSSDTSLASAMSEYVDPPPVPLIDPFVPVRMYERTVSFDIPGLSEGDVIRLEMEVLTSAERATGRDCDEDETTVGQAFVRVLADGDVVHELWEAYRLHQSSGQNSSGVRFVTQTDGDDDVTFYNPNRRHFTVRDAETGALIKRTRLGQITSNPEDNAIVIPGIGHDRLVEIITEGDDQMFKVKVADPPSLWAATVEDWFDPHSE